VTLVAWWFKICPRFLSEPDRERVRSGQRHRFTGRARLLNTTCPGRISAHRSDADRWDSRRWVHPPYINCERPVPAGPLLGGPGGSTCPGAPRLPPRPVRWERAGVRADFASRPVMRMCPDRIGRPSWSTISWSNSLLKVVDRDRDHDPFRLFLPLAPPRTSASSPRV
jgi:hypothetical protein